MDEEKDITLIIHVFLVGIAVALLLAASYFIIAIFSAFTDPVITIPGPPPASLDKLRGAHRYHGINNSEFDETTGQWIFYRDGRRCKLFAYLPSPLTGEGQGEGETK